MYILRKCIYLAWSLHAKKNYKCFIGYKDDENEIKELCRMLPKASAYVKSMMEKLYGCSFLLMMMSC